MHALEHFPFFQAESALFESCLANAQSGDGRLILKECVSGTEVGEV